MHGQFFEMDLFMTFVDPAKVQGNVDHTAIKHKDQGLKFNVTYFMHTISAITKEPTYSRHFNLQLQ